MRMQTSMWKMVLAGLLLGQLPACSSGSGSGSSDPGNGQHGNGQRGGNNGNNPTGNRPQQPRTGTQNGNQAGNQNGNNLTGGQNNGSGGMNGGPGGQPNGGGNQTQGQLAQLLLSSSWCSFSYSGSGGSASGSSVQRRATFGTDGVLRVVTSGENLSSGSNGSSYGSSNNEESSNYSIQNDKVYILDQQSQNWLEMPLQLKTNSNGAPILQTQEGTEWSRC